MQFFIQFEDGKGKKLWESMSGFKVEKNNGRLSTRKVAKPHFMTKIFYI